MPGELHEIIDEVVAIQTALTPPTGFDAIKIAHDEPPAAPQLYPCFFNAEESITEIERVLGTRSFTFRLNMHLLFTPAGGDYSVQAARRWVRPVLDAFDRAVVLNNNQSPIQDAEIESIDFAPIEWNESSYLGVTFTLVAQATEAFAPEA